MIELCWWCKQTCLDLQTSICCVFNHGGADTVESVFVCPKVGFQSITWVILSTLLLKEWVGTRKWRCFSPSSNRFSTNCCIRKLDAHMNDSSIRAVSVCPWRRTLFRSLHHPLKMFDPDAIPFIFFPAFLRSMHLLIWASLSCLQHLDTIWENKTECQVRKENKPLKITLSTGVSGRWKTRPALFVFFFSSSDCARRRADKD